MRKVIPAAVASGVYQLGLGGVNVFFVEDDDGGLVLIDTGIAPGAERIGAGLRALGRAPKELRGIVVTHLHGDHTGGLAAVKAHTGAEVWMQAADAAAVREGVRGRALEPGPGLVRSVIVRTIGRKAAGRTGDPIAVEHEVQDGDVLPFAGMTAVCTPGHTLGHLALLLPQGRRRAVHRRRRDQLRASRRRSDLRGRGRGYAEPAPALGARVRDGAVLARAAAAAAGLRALSRSLRPRLTGRAPGPPAVDFRRGRSVCPRIAVDARAPRRIVSSRVLQGGQRDEEER